MTNAYPDFSLAYYSGDRKTGTLVHIRNSNGQIEVTTLPSGKDSGLDKALKPVMVGTTGTQAVLLDPQSKELNVVNEFPEDAFAAHVYSDPYTTLDWFMNDGDKETGNDTLNCGSNGSSVSVVENSNSGAARYLGTVCVGRGHHQAAFTWPSTTVPNAPRRAVISNLKDGTLSFVGSDPNDSATFLKVLATLNLCEPDKEQGLQADAVPNNAFPHGLVYSSVTGKLYNLNNGYGTVVVIDPATAKIEKRINFKGHSNLFISRDGRYVIGRGADRKSDPDHVIAKLSVLDVTDNTVVDSINLSDIYISKYFFNVDGSRLFLTTSSSGSEDQQKNLKTDVVACFDMTALPKLKQTHELKLGSVGTLDFLSDGTVFSSDGPNGEVVVLDGGNLEIVERIRVNSGQPHSRLWLLPN
ncbi:MAG: hypothetical protein OEZ43_16510 [Gammaproteobacteria bacterium]|nr:hypothetical protein [Gammaproteobacteria bacterium]